MKPFRRCNTRIFILCLLTISVFVPLFLLPHKLKHLGSDVSKEFAEDLSIIKHRVEVQTLNAVEEKESQILSEPLSEVYKDVGLRSGVSLTSSDENNSTSESTNTSQDIHGSQTNKSSGTYNVKKDNTNKKELTLQTKQAISREKKQSNETKSRKALDEMIKEGKDQIMRAKVYLKMSPPDYTSHIVKELRYRIRELEHSMSDSKKDSDLSRRAVQKMKAMESTLAKANKIYPDCTAITKKLRAMTYNSEEQVRAQKDQRSFLIQVAGRTTPKGLHCLSMRLTFEFFQLQPEERDLPNQHKLNDPSLYHFALFSDNILASAVVINSTISSSKEPEKIVFHIITDSLNSPAMIMWFLLNPPKKAAIEVQSMENFGWLVTKYDTHFEKQDSLDLRFTSPLNHLRFYLPDIYPRLDKILLLDHDVVVQKDLTKLWKVNMKGKVNGAVETCNKDEASFRKMDMFMNFTDPVISKKFDVNTCTWAFGMNIFDLKEWRKRDLTGVYHNYLQMVVKGKGKLVKAGSLPIGWMTFYGQTIGLDKKWHVLGLGYESGVNVGEIVQGGVIHYDGIMKPWLDIGIDKYKGYWKKYVDFQHTHLQQCNIHD